MASPNSSLNATNASASNLEVIQLNKYQISELKQQIAELKQHYEPRIHVLNNQLDELHNNNKSLLKYKND